MLPITIDFRVRAAHLPLVWKHLGLEAPWSGKGSQADNPHAVVLFKIYKLLEVGRKTKQNKKPEGQEGGNVTCLRKLLT